MLSVSVRRFRFGKRFLDLHCERKVITTAAEMHWTENALLPTSIEILEEEVVAWSMEVGLLDLERCELQLNVAIEFPTETNIHLNGHTM